MSTNPADLVEGGNGGFPNVKPWPPEAMAEIERLRAGIISLLEMPAACTADAEVIENVKRRKRAMDLIGAHRVLRDDQQRAQEPK